MHYQCINIDHNPPCYLPYFEVAVCKHAYITVVLCHFGGPLK